MYETEYVTQAILDSGSVKVEVSDDNGETWFSMPYHLIEGDDTGVEWIYTNEYYYEEDDDIMPEMIDLRGSQPLVVDNYASRRR